MIKSAPCWAAIRDILCAVQAGSAVVIQDVRGRYASEGEFDLDYSNGKKKANNNRNCGNRYFGGPSSKRQI
jgi:X-Pro dipeptidyl-peptidase (S15 family)